MPLIFSLRCAVHALPPCGLPPPSGAQQAVTQRSIDSYRVAVIPNETSPLRAYLPQDALFTMGGYVGCTRGSALLPATSTAFASYSATHIRSDLSHGATLARCIPSVQIRRATANVVSPEVNRLNTQPPLRDNEIPPTTHKKSRYTMREPRALSSPPSPLSRHH
jgi:hypothetical protein